MSNKEDCPLCPKDYQSRRKLIQHLGKIHGIDKIAAERFLYMREQGKETSKAFEGAVLHKNGVRMNK